MNSPLLDYSLPPSSSWQHRPWRILGIVAGLIVLAFGAVVIPSYKVEVWMDAVTGSTSTKTVWFFGLTTTRMQVSGLEPRMKRSGIQWTPCWQHMCTTHKNIFGSDVCNACGRAPVICGFRSVLEEFAAVSSDAELRKFVAVMQSGTKAEQQAACEAAARKARPTE